LIGIYNLFANNWVLSAKAAFSLRATLPRYSPISSASATHQHVSLLYQLVTSVWMTMENEIELLNAARAKGKDAFVKIFDLYASALYKYAFRLGHDPVMADQIVGDVFSNLLEQISQGKGPKTNLRGYLYQSTYHMIVDHSRSLKRSAPLEAANLFRNDIYSRSQSLEDQAMFDVVFKVIRKDLTEDQRHVIVLRFFEEFSLKETAAILGKEVSHIKVIQSRALAKLRQKLLEDERRHLFFRKK
jgi:RNA polymerase sigma-70 factor (ECF subfamily)